MRLRLYNKGPQVGYLGWIESLSGDLIAFVRKDGTFQWWKGPETLEGI